MRKLGQNLPSADDLEATLQALPGEYVKRKWYGEGRIFHLLFNGIGKNTNYCTKKGDIKICGCSVLMSSSEGVGGYCVLSFKYDGYTKMGQFGSLPKSNTHPVRTLLD